jgi:hypothetical protein
MPTPVTSKFLLGLHDGYGEAATFTSSVAAQTGFPLPNLQDWSLFNKRCRLAVGSLTAVTLTMDLGAAVEFNALILAAVNFSLAATRRIEASTVSNFASTVIDTGGTLLAAFDTSLGSLVEVPRPHGRHLIYVHTASVTARYVRWTITDAANADGYLSAAFGRATMGFQPGINLDESWERGAKPVGSPGAQRMQRNHRLRLHRLTRAEAAKVESAVEAATETGRFLVLPEPQSPATWLDDAIVGNYAGSQLRRQRVRRTIQPVRYELELEFREVLR